MRRFSIHLFILAIIAIVVMPACDGLDENYSTNPTHRLSFSTDTLSFDTVFSTIGSTTKQFMIYNTNSDPLNIESIMLASGEATGFRINVDGRKGSRFNNVGILAKDSMYVLVEVTVDPNGGDQPLLIEDSVLFTVNGIRQSVLLEAYGQDVNLMRGGIVIESDSTLRANRPYLVYDSVVVSSGARVNIEKGAIFYMHDKAKLVVEGSINALGTKDDPIVFRGDRLDYILSDLLPYDRTPGQWDGILFKSDSYDNILENVIVRNGISGLYFEPSSVERNKIRIVDSQITNMETDLLYALNCDITAINSEFSNACGNVITLVGGKYQFTHCTIANYMSLKKREFSNRIFPLESRTLYLINEAEITDGVNPAIINARFDNCIIDGGFEDELSIKDEGSGFKHMFNHCLIKGKSRDGENFNGCEFIKRAPSYRMLGSKADKYTFDFRPDSASSVMVGKADPEIVKSYPFDRYKVNRLTNEFGASIGAYEFVKDEEIKE